MIRLENTDELLEMVEQEMKEFVRLYNPDIFIHKKLYNLLLQFQDPVTLKIYSSFSDKYQLITASLLEFICLSLENFQLEIYIEEVNHIEDQNLVVYWIEEGITSPLLVSNTSDLELDFQSFIEAIQLSMIDTIKENIHGKSI